MIKLYGGDCLDVLRKLPANHFDTIITDPPYGLGFMGKEWDTFDAGSYDYSRNAEFQRWFTVWAKEVLRVAKPGAFALIFGGTRTFHRLTCAIEDAGWVIRDCMMWLYGSGFPKSHDISKAIDKTKKAKREVVGKYVVPGFAKTEVREGKQNRNKYEFERTSSIPTTDLARKWNGWGTALKPAWEPIIVAMKPLDGTFAQNAEKYGVAGLWIDGGRIGGNLWKPHDATGLAKEKFFTKGETPIIHKEPHNLGRWPANLLLDEEAGKMLDEQSGISKSTGGVNPGNLGKRIYGKYALNKIGRNAGGLGGPGGASRFFMECGCTFGDLLWSNTFVDFAEKLLWNIQVTIENFAPTSVEDWQKEKKNLIARCVEKKLNATATSIVLVLAGIKTLVFNQEALQAIQGSIGNCNECIQILNLVLSVVKQDNIDTIQTTLNLLKSFGYVPVVTKSCILKTNQLELCRFKYQPKASKKERGEYNTHPTCKPLVLMEYLCKLTKTPTGGVVLDPFGGSGTTALACMNTGRDCVIIEKEPAYCEIIRTRVKANDSEKD